MKTKISLQQKNSAKKQTSSSKFVKHLQTSQFANNEEPINSWINNVKHL